MTVRKRLAGVLTTGAAIAAVTALAATPAAAADQDITITNPNSDDVYEAEAENAVTMTDVDSGISFDCEVSTSDGEIFDGSYTTPDTVGEINVDFDDCNGPLGVATVETNDEPYDLVVDSYDSSEGDDGQGFGYIGPVDVHVSMTGCSFDVTGNAPGYYDNDTHTLTMGGSLPSGVDALEPENINGCSGIVSAGDELTYEGDYEVTDPTDPSIIIGEQ